MEGLNGSTRIEHAQTYLENIKLTKINNKNSASNSTFYILKQALNQLIAQNPTISSFVLEAVNRLCALTNNKAEFLDVNEVFEGIYLVRTQVLNDKQVEYNTQMNKMTIILPRNLLEQ